MSEKPVKVMISKAPDDPELKKKWVSEMMSIQIGLWLGDGATCIFCKHTYESIDDFTKRSPVRGHTDEMSFVCKDCYIPYKAILEITPEQLTKVTEGSST